MASVRNWVRNDKIPDEYELVELQQSAKAYPEDFPGEPSDFVLASDGALNMEPDLEHVWLGYTWPLYVEQSISTDAGVLLSNTIDTRDALSVVDITLACRGKFGWFRPNEFELSLFKEWAGDMLGEQHDNWKQFNPLWSKHPVVRFFVEAGLGERDIGVLLARVGDIRNYVIVSDPYNPDFWLSCWGLTGDSAIRAPIALSYKVNELLVRLCATEHEHLWQYSSTQEDAYLAAKVMGLEPIDCGYQGKRLARMIYTVWTALVDGAGVEPIHEEARQQGISPSTLPTLQGWPE